MGNRTDFHGGWRLSVVVAAALAAGAMPAIPASAGRDAEEVRRSPVAAGQEQESGRGDDLARIRRWRSFLDRAHRAFFASRMSTTAVKAKIEQADARIEELENAPADDEGGRSDITGDANFLERAERAFTFAHMDTADVKRWLAEAREGGDGLGILSPEADLPGRGESSATAGFRRSSG